MSEFKNIWLVGDGKLTVYPQAEVVNPSNKSDQYSIACLAVLPLLATPHQSRDTYHQRN